MSTLFPPGLFGAAMEEYLFDPPCVNGARTINIIRNFDPNLLFLGQGEDPLKLCQILLEKVIDNPVFCTSKPSICVPTLMPNTINELPMTARHLQMVSFGNKFNWKRDPIEGLFYMTNYDALKLEGIKCRREIPVEDFIEECKIPLNNLFGVIYQKVAPTWLSSIHSAEIFNFKKRLAGVLRIPMTRIFWIQQDNDFCEFIERVMLHVYRSREDRECEENERIARGEIERTKEIIEQELKDPITMCYGDVAEKKGITLSEGV